MLTAAPGGTAQHPGVAAVGSSAADAAVGRGAGGATADGAVVAGTRPAVRTPPWTWPTDSFRVIARPFDPPARRWLAGHRGVDLVGVLNEPVRAVDDGVVTFSGEVAGVGVVSITHDEGLRSTYQPVAERVREGAAVARGQRLGVLDDGGHCLLLHCLHLGAVRGQAQYLDPSLLLGEVRLTLLPRAASGG